MKKILLMLSLLCLPTLFTAQNLSSFSLKGMNGCLEKKDQAIINELFTEIDALVQVEFNSDNPYYEFAVLHADRKVDSTFFVVQQGSRLDSIILEALKTGAWIHTDDTDDESDDEPFTMIIDGMEVTDFEITLPRADPTTIERYRIKADSEIIKCFQTNLSINNMQMLMYYSEYEQLMWRTSGAKAWSNHVRMTADDYKTAFVRYFFAVDVIMQKILHENDYEAYIRR